MADLEEEKTSIISNNCTEQCQILYQENKVNFQYHSLTVLTRNENNFLSFTFAEIIQIFPNI